MSGLSKNKAFLPASLQGRYLLIATLFITTVIIAAWWSSHHAYKVQNQSASQLLIKNQSAHMIQNIRFSLWQANQALQEFMITPSGAQQDKIDNAMNSARLHLSSLRALFSDTQPKWLEMLSVIEEKSRSLKLDLRKLASIRQNHALLHPASTTMNEVMLPMNTKFQTASTLALDQLQPSQNTQDMQLYRLLDHIKDNWITMIGAFRVFVANRFGAFSNSESSLRGQKQNIELLHKQINTDLSKLEALRSDIDFGIQVEASLEEMQTAEVKWFEAYKVVAESYASEKWRTDMPFLRTAIQPEFESLWDMLAELDLSIESASSKEVVLYGNLANQISNILWLFSVLAFLLTVVGYFALQRTVISPLTDLSSAFTEEAAGKRRAHLLPKISVTEMQQLIHAFTHMSEKVHKRTTELQHKAHYDSLTGLPNRLMLEKQLLDTLNEAKQSSIPVSIMVIDFDDFKNVNDMYGHHIGDEFLKIIGQRFLSIARKNEMVARLGGDEFGVILPGSTKNDALHVAEQIISRVCRPCTIGDTDIPVSMSIGISIYPKHGTKSEQLLRHADDAMYQAKRKKENIAVYDPKVVPLIG
jgi:diguanylate cyclase (GGDEF)-like protein